MDFTSQNRGKWIVTLPSTNRIDNTRIIHPILNLIVTSPSTNRINNRGKGKEQYKRLGIRNGIKQNTKWQETKQEMTQQKKRVCQNVHILFLCTKPRLSQARALLFPKVFVPLGIKKISL